MIRDGKATFSLIGCGAVSKKHISAIKSFGLGEIVAVCDRDLSLAKQTGNVLGVPFFQDSKAMALEKPSDIISVLTPSGDHVNQVLSLAGLARNILVEKPLALSVKDIDRMIEECTSTNTGLFVVKQNRCNRPIVKLREAITSRRLGEIVLGTVRVRWSRDQSYFDKADWRGTINEDGGVLANQAAHHVDMLLWMLGDVESVYSMSSTRLVDIEAEETSIVSIKFKSGALGMIEATTATRPKDLEGSISILGSNGAVEVGGFSMNELKTWNFHDTLAEDDTVFSEWGMNPSKPVWNLGQYLSDVISTINGENNFAVVGEFGRRSIEIIEAARISQKTGSEVSLADIKLY